MDTSNRRVAGVLRGLRYALTCILAEDKIPTYRPGGILWHVVAFKFDTYTRIHMAVAMGRDPWAPAA